jgi:hypothetical protein
LIGVGKMNVGLGLPQERQRAMGIFLLGQKTSAPPVFFHLAQRQNSAWHVRVPYWPNRFSEQIINY